MSSTPEQTKTEASRSDRELRDALGDVGRAFFDFPTLSDVQRAVIAPIAEGENVLVCAATAAGKTEAVIAPLVWRVRRAAANHSKKTLVLAIAPTRALVADLVERLAGPLGQIGWRCGAQTSDFAGATGEPEVLITTPESLDSMLVRRFRREDGKVCGHLLSDVRAVFVDEAHCFDSTARGDQLKFLLVRLRKLREFAFKKEWCYDATFHICAASATVDQPEILAERVLGKGAKAISCAGRRPIDILQGDGKWLRLEPEFSIRELSLGLPRLTAKIGVGPILWNALQSGERRKALVFVPSRRDCDRIGLELRRYLSQHRAIWVDSHHGSLSREHRQRAEQGFHQNRDAVLVATNTLEVGVDIGDVDLVVLVGAPPDTSSLLQRIGRGGRRTGLTRLIALMRNNIEAAALASQLRGAVEGRLETKQRFCRWDVYPQQVISYIRQNQGAGRSQSSLVDLATDTWQDKDCAVVAETFLREWLDAGQLKEQRGKIHLGGDWQKFAAEEESDYIIHSNIRSGAVGIAVRNNVSGEIIGHVSGGSDGGQTLTIAGRQHRVVRHDAELVVAPVMDDSGGEDQNTPQYKGRRRRISETFAAHVRRGCGLQDFQAPLVRAAGSIVWFHFGGEIFEKALRELHPGICDKPVIAGIAMQVMRTFDSAEIQSYDKDRLHHFVRKEQLRLIEDESLGKFADELPMVGIERLIQESCFEERIRKWIGTRQVSGAVSVSELPILGALLDIS
jgi:ATP-dependent Lhr-like helicase